VCVFHACGVTPQSALLAAKIPIAITHAPGHMLVLDVTNKALAGAGGSDGVASADGGAGRSGGKRIKFAASGP
jgi:hypothetical protein